DLDRDAVLRRHLLALDQQPHGPDVEHPDLRARPQDSVGNRVQETAQLAALVAQAAFVVMDDDPREQPASWPEQERDDEGDERHEQDQRDEDRLHRASLASGSPCRITDRRRGPEARKAGDPLRRRGPGMTSGVCRGEPADTGTGRCQDRPARWAGWLRGRPRPDARPPATGASAIPAGPPGPRPTSPEW